MKITKTNSELNAILLGIKSIAAETELKLPAKVCYLLTKNRIALEDALKAYHEASDDIVKRYAKEGESSIRINKEEDPETFNAVTNAFEEIGNDTAEVEITPISIDALDGYDISFRLIDAISCLLKDGDS